MTRDELIAKLMRWPKDAEVLIELPDAEDYIPIRDAGYAKNLDIFLIDPNYDYWKEEQ
jgi:hypothetical protein